MTKRRILTVGREVLAGLFRAALKVSPRTANRFYEGLDPQRLPYLQAHGSLEELVAFDDINFLFLPTDHPVRTKLESLS